MLFARHIRLSESNFRVTIATVLTQCYIPCLPNGDMEQYTFHSCKVPSSMAYKCLASLHLTHFTDIGQDRIITTVGIVVII